MLEYHSRYKCFHCARLEILLDSITTADGGGTKGALAMVKESTTDKVTESRIGSIILVRKW